MKPKSIIKGNPTFPNRVYNDLLKYLVEREEILKSEANKEQALQELQRFMIYYVVTYSKLDGEK